MDAEHIPTDAYRLLRRLVVSGPQRLPTPTPDDEAATEFLVTRGLAVRAADNALLEATEAGRGVGRILKPAP